MAKVEEILHEEGVGESPTTMRQAHQTAVAVVPVPYGHLALQFPEPIATHMVQPSRVE